jgi:hypothetical protein
VDSVDPGPRGTLGALEIGDKRGDHGNFRPVDACKHRLRVGQLRHGARADEGGHLHVADAGREERIRDLDLPVGRNEGLLRLEPIARTDFADRDPRAFGH